MADVKKIYISQVQSSTTWICHSKITMSVCGQ